MDGSRTAPVEGEDSSPASDEVGAEELEKNEGTPSDEDILQGNTSPWMEFQLKIRQRTKPYDWRTTACFADSGASANFMSVTLAKSLGLKGWGGKSHVVLEGGKWIPSYGRCEIAAKAGKFVASFEVVLVDIRTELIVGRPFWEKFQVSPNYTLGGIQAHTASGKHHLAYPRFVRKELKTLTEGLQMRMMHSSDMKRELSSGCEHVLWMIRQGIEDDAESTKEGDLRTTGDDELDKKLGPLLKCFRTELPDEMPPQRWVDHEIDTGDAKPINRPTYSLSVSQLEEQEKQIQYLLSHGLVQPSKSAWGAPVIFVRKKGGEWRMCIDYRALNNVTVRNAYPLPRIEECLDQLKDARFFSKLDMLSGYWQVRVKEEDRHKTAFNTRTGKWEFCVLPFGLMNAPSTFQKMMNDILREYIGDFVQVYIDDILIFSRTREEHIKHCRTIFERLMENKLFLKRTKCSFLQKSVEFCGFIVGDGEIRMDPEKIRTIQEWPRPETVQHVRSFCGLCSWYRQFIRGFAAIAAPLYDLIRTADKDKKTAPVMWNAAAEYAFVRLKEVMSAEPVLVQPDLTKPFIIETDASDFAYGAVLLQLSYDGKEHVIAFVSHAFTPTERRYPTHERELLALKIALRKWERYIMNHTRTTVRTDHQGLQYMNTVKKPSQRLARWIDEFAAYELDIVYKPGSKMVAADALSRRSDYEELRTMVAATEHLRTMTFIDFMVAYKENGSLPEGEHAHFAEEIRTKAEDFVLEDGVLYRRQADELVPVIGWLDRATMLERIHGEIGHAAARTMIDILKPRAWWPTLERDVRHFVRHCTACQLTRRTQEHPTDEMHPGTQWRGSVQPFERWGLDLIGRLPRTARGNRWIVTAIDYATRWPIAVAISDATSDELAEFVLREIYLSYGPPKEIITDRGANLWAPAMTQVLARMRTKHRGTTPYHPRTNGMVENLNGTLGRSIAKYLVGQPRKCWDLYLNQALYHARVRTHTTTEQSPFYMLYGVHPRLLDDEVGPMPETDDLREDPGPMMETIRAETQRRTELREKTNKRYFDRTQVRPATFEEGDWVLVRRGNPRKWEARFWGPYKVNRVMWANTYELTKPSGQRVKDLIHGDRLHRARTTGRVTRGWNMPGRPIRRDHGSENNPNRAIARDPENEFEDMPDEYDGDSGGEF